MAQKTPEGCGFYTAATVGMAVFGGILAVGFAGEAYRSFAGKDWSKDLGEGRKIAYKSGFLLDRQELVITQTSFIEGRESLKLSKVTATRNGELSIKAVGQQTLDQTLDHLRRVCVITGTEPLVETGGNLTTEAKTPNTSCIANQG
jgi:hypothetical protein